jgi:hypothetical protein
MSWAEMLDVLTDSDREKESSSNAPPKKMSHQK